MLNGGLCLQGFRNPKGQLSNLYACSCRSGRNSTNGARFVNYSYGFSNIIVGTNNYWMTSGFTFGCPRIHHFKLRFVLQFCILFWCSIGGTILPSSTLPPVDRAKSSIWIVAQFRCLNSHCFHIMGGRWKNQPKYRVYMPNFVGFVYPI